MRINLILRQSALAGLLLLGSLLLVACESLRPWKRPLSAFLRTDSAVVGVRHSNHAYAANIGYVFTNTTGKTISIAMCGRWPGNPYLEKRVAGKWVPAYLPAYLLCRTIPDFTFDPGATYRGVLDFLAYEPGQNALPRIEVDSIDGVYRLRWSFTEGTDATAEGARRVEAVSNEFRMVLRERSSNTIRRRIIDSTRVSPLRDSAQIVAAFRDTADVRVRLADSRTFDLRTRGQRDSLRTTLNNERNKWRASNPREYQYLLHVDCFCPGRRGWLLIEVRQGRPLRAWDRTGKTAPLADWNTFSVDTLFDMLERAVNMDGVVHVAFDPRWHFPANVRTVRLPGPDAWTIIDARGLKPLTKE